MLTPHVAFYSDASLRALPRVAGCTPRQGEFRTRFRDTPGLGHGPAACGRYRGHMDVAGGGALLVLAAVLWLVYLLPAWMARRRRIASQMYGLELQQTVRAMAEIADAPAEVFLEANARTVRAQRRLERELERADALRLETAVHEVEAANQAASVRAREAQARADRLRMLATLADRGILAAQRRSRGRRLRAGLALVALGGLALATVGWMLGLAVPGALLASLGAGTWLLATVGLVAVARATTRVERFRAATRRPTRTSDAGRTARAAEFSGTPDARSTSAIPNTRTVRASHPENPARVRAGVTAASAATGAAGSRTASVPPAAEVPTTLSGLAHAAWTPSPLPTPLHLSHGTIAAAVVASMETAARLQRDASREEYARRVARDGVGDAARRRRPETVAQPAPAAAALVATPTPVLTAVPVSGASAPSRAATSTADATGSLYARMGYVDPVTPAFADVEALLQRRRAAG